MLAPINVINQKNQIVKLKSLKKDFNPNEKITECKKDCFLKNNISFAGRNLNALKRDFEISLISDAKRNMHTGLETWKEELYNIKYQNLKNNRASHSVSIHGQSGSYNTNDIVDRVMIGIFSLGFSELERASENSDFRKDARNFVDKMVILRSELEHIKFNEELAKMNKDTTKNSNEIIYETSIQNLKNEEIKPKLLDKVRRFREGRPTEMPNCVMLSHKDSELNKKLIAWIGDQTNGYFEEFDSKKDIIEKLESLENKYQSSGSWNVLYVPTLDKNITTKFSNETTIAKYKDIMSNCAEDYHTTIIFQTNDKKSLDPIALQKHRVTEINTSKIKSKNELEIDSANSRLEDSNYIEKTPIAALNDLLLISDNSDLNLKWNYTEKDFQNVENILKSSSKIEEKHKSNLTKILDSLKGLW